MLKLVNRVLFGNKNGAYGGWISKPGHDVLSASIDNMLLSTDRPAFMVIGQGVVAAFTGINQTRDIYIPDVGFRPLFILGCARFGIEVIYNSRTSITLKSVVENLFHSDGNCYYAYTNEAF